MQGNRDGSWSLRASANDGCFPQANRVVSNFSIHQPIRYNFQTPQQNLNFLRPQFGAGANVEVSRIDNAVNKMRKSLVAAGENVSSTRVSQLVLAQLQADSWRSLGMQIQDVPSFRQLMALEGKKELVTEALEEQIPTEITDASLVAGYDDCAGTSSKANKPKPSRAMSMKSGSTPGNLVHEWNNSISTDFSARDHQLHTSTAWAAQAQQTGRKGEEIAYRYFAAKYGKKAQVRWANEQSETGLTYDLIIENRGGKKEYVEVKATV